MAARNNCTNSADRKLATSTNVGNGRFKSLILFVFTLLPLFRKRYEVRVLAWQGIEVEVVELAWHGAGRPHVIVRFGSAHFGIIRFGTVYCGIAHNRAGLHLFLVQMLSNALFPKCPSGEFLNQVNQL